MNRARFLKGKSVLITGGTGSFGQQFAEVLLRDGLCRRVIIFSRDEFKQFQMEQHLKKYEDALRFFLGDVRDLGRLERAFDKVDIVIHAAALKQVPALEFNPLEAIKTNILGTQKIIDAALNKKVEKVLLVSTDKAVNPVNLYGATKLCAEKLFVAANAYRKTTSSPPAFSVVRYGNVVGSRGSFLEKLKQQKDGEPVLLTHEEMTRFWITLPQASELVLKALRSMKGGEIFVPKLSAMNIKELIKAVAPKSKIRTIGIRPGEKIHETLMTEDEVKRARVLNQHYIIEPMHPWWKGSHLRRFPVSGEGFIYSSDKVNSLKPEELIKLV